MSYDAIIFDFDGVLITGRATPAGVYKTAVREILEAYGVHNPDTWEKGLERPTDAAAFRERCEQRDLPPAEAWGYREAVSTHIEETWLDRGDREPFPDTRVLSELAEKYTIGIASNNRHALVGTCIERFGWTTIIDGHRGRYPTLTEYDRRKPNPRFVREMVQELGVTDPLYVGDRESDVVAAERVGCDSVYLRRESSHGAIDRTPTYEVTSLTELAEQLQAP